MKKLAIALTLVSGLYITGKAKAEGTDQLKSKTDSSQLYAPEISSLEMISSEVGTVAEALLNSPELAGESLRQDVKTTEEFEMTLISAQAGHAADRIREGGE